MKMFLVLVLFFVVNGQLSLQFSPLFANGNAGINQTTRSCEERVGAGRPCIKSGDACYCFIPTQRSWKDAFEFCKLNEMSLLSVESLQKQLEVQTIVPRLTTGNKLVNEIGLWTSGVFIRAKGTFVWANNLQRFQFVNWAYGCPITSQYDCVRIEAGSDFLWVDTDCKEWLPFVCESYEETPPKEVESPEVGAEAEFELTTSKPGNTTETSFPSENSNNVESSSFKPSKPITASQETSVQVSEQLSSDKKPDSVHLHLSVSLSNDEKSES